MAGSSAPHPPRAHLPPILFQDEHFVILNKPAGLPAHAGPRGGPSVEDWFPALSRRRDGPWLAHRLDTDTSGCLVIALRKTPLLAAQDAFRTGQARKVYWAIVRGEPAGSSGRIDAALIKRSDANGWRMQADASGQRAVTDWIVRGRAGGMAWLELKPHTGRTHQIRVHCALLGWPVYGDPIYGDGAGPLQLLARAITLPLNPVLTAEAPAPPHMAQALESCGFRP